MEYPRPKIPFYKVRTFGEKLNISFEFLRETWKPLLKMSFYLILPLCLIQAFAMEAYIRMAFAISGNPDHMTTGLVSFLGNYGLLMLCFLVGSCVLSALVYSLMQTYERRERRLLDITLADVKALFMKNVGKMFKVTLFIIGVVLLLFVIIALLAWVSLWTLVVTIPVLLIGLILVAIPLALFTPLYLFEDMPFAVALNKALRYGFSAWGEMFLVVLVFGMLGGIISGVTTMPWYVVTVIGQVFAQVEPDSGINSALWYRVATYLLGIIQSYGTYISSIISSVGIAFQYFHLRETKEGVSVKADIANFDRL
ncbi:MAG: hypothetical protein LBT83_11815 [Tannerella sp.]|jgi:hypothetical protein|nr:hypothetical protein [Tannerella sp.]